VGVLVALKYGIISVNFQRLNVSKTQRFKHSTFQTLIKKIAKTPSNIPSICRDLYTSEKIKTPIANPYILEHIFQEQFNEAILPVFKTIKYNNKGIRAYNRQLVNKNKLRELDSLEYLTQKRAIASIKIMRRKIRKISFVLIFFIYYYK